MAAYFDSGFSVREPMWHGDGNVLADYPENWKEARKFAGLEWDPIEQSLFVNVRAGDDSAAPEFVVLDSHKAIVRSDTRAVLGVPSGDYSIIDHDKMGEIVEAILDVDTAVKFETAGSVRDGKQVWALAYIDEPITVPGDDSETLPFLALLNSHDGSAACKVVATSVRVVCWNTFQMASAQGDRSGRQFTFRHTGDVSARIDEAKKALAGVRDETKQYAEFAAALAKVRVDDAVVSMFLHDFIADPAEHGEIVSDRVRDNVSKARATFMGLYNDSPTTAALHGTAYGLLQTSTEYLDHVRAFRSRDTYMSRTLLRAEPAKEHAVATLARIVPAVGELVAV